MLTPQVKMGFDISFVSKRVYVFEMSCLLFLERKKYHYVDICEVFPDCGKSLSVLIRKDFLVLQMCEYLSIM